MEKPNREQQWRIVSQAVVIDFDRTIADSDKCLNRLVAIANRFHIDTDALMLESKRVVDTGGSFDPLIYVKAVLTQEQMKRFESEFINPEGEALVYEDVGPFLKMLDDNAIPYAVLTHGVSKEWQELKIKASGYKGPYRIINHRKKAKEIAKLYSSDGGYQFSSLYDNSPQGNREDISADTICLIDDKAVAFNGLPSNCIGYLLVRGEKMQKSQQGKLPRNAVSIHNLGNLEAVNHHIQVKQLQK